MEDEIEDSVVLSKIRFKIKQLEDDLAELKAAERVILRFGQRRPWAAEKPIDAPKSAPEVKSTKSLTETVMEAVGKARPSTTSNIVKWVRENHNPSVNKNSIRSMLSVAKKAGKLTRSEADDQWHIA